VTVAADGITLPDGRRLSWYEFGDQDGSPVIYTAGTPVSGRGAVLYDETARAAGLRWIAPDKPGYGGSDYQPERTLLSWAGDLTVLADHLGLKRFALVGESGGGPYTLAAAHELGNRVSAAVLIASSGLRDQDEAAEAKRKRRLLLWITRRPPVLTAAHMTVLRWQMLTPAWREFSLRRDLARTPPARRAARRIEYEVVTDALRPGIRGTVQDLGLLVPPWGFDLGDVTVPVHLWHGARDTTVPVGHSRRLAQLLPDATLHLNDTSEHDVGVDRAAEIMDLLASYANGLLWAA
jgi:pimeloyl-ACP methyl ester carboxylesterase